MTSRGESLWPGWLWVLVGYLLASSTSAVSRAPFECDERLIPRESSPREPRSHRELSVRELRSLPGIGQMRALAIARTRWQAERAGRAFELESVPGIGPRIAQRMESALAALRGP